MSRGIGQNMFYYIETMINNEDGKRTEEKKVYSNIDRKSYSNPILNYMESMLSYDEDEYNYFYRPSMVSFPPLPRRRSIVDLYLNNLLNVPSYRDVDILEQKMLDLALSESLNYYKTQEKKPNMKINIKTSKYIGENNESCTICSDDIENNQDIIELKCKHIFHPNCIEEWVMYKPECPVCRGEVDVIDTSNVKKEEEGEYTNDNTKTSDEK